MTLFDRLALAGIGLAVAVALLAGWSLLALSPSRASDPFASFAPSSVEPQSVLVDIEGAVVFPGLHELPAGARLADAIAAAGGYSDAVDLEAAAASLNLAAALADGQQIVVPAVGAGSVDSGGIGRLVNLNTADGPALDGLPGIGPVTVQKILAARAEQPFATLDELVERKVLTGSQLDKIRDLVTVP